MDSQSVGADSVGNVSIHDLPGPDPGHELVVLSDLHADLGGECLEGGPNQQRESYHRTSADSAGRAVIAGFELNEESRSERPTLQQAMMEWLEKRKRPVIYNEWQKQWFQLRRQKYEDPEEEPGARYSPEQIQVRMRKLFDTASEHFYGSEYLSRAAKAFDEEAKKARNVAEKLQRMETRGGMLVGRTVDVGTGTLSGGNSPAATPEQASSVPTSPLQFSNKQMKEM